MIPALGLLALLAVATMQGQVLSAEKEAALARQLAAEFRRHSRTLDVPEVQAWVERIGAQLAGGFRAGIQWSFEVTAEEGSTEPQALPGGSVFVPAGAILAATDAAGLIRTLAHQMAHAANPNSLRPARLSGANLASIPLVFMGGWLGHHQDRLLPVAMKEQAEQLEREADALADEALAKAGAVPAEDLSHIQQLLQAKSRPIRRPPTLHRK